MARKGKISKLISSGLAVPLSFLFMPHSSAAQDFNTSRLKDTFPSSAKYQQLTQSSKFAFGKDTIKWISDDGIISENAKTLLTYLQNSDTHGLNPDNYKVDEIVILMSGFNSSWVGGNKGKLNGLLTEAFIDYVRDMSGPRIDPAVVDSKSSYWRRSLFETEIIKKYYASDSFGSFLDGLKPNNPMYDILQTELTSLLELQSELKAGSEDSIVNQSIIEQVIVNMEKLRWDQQRPERYIEVNIADQTLSAVEQGRELYKIKMIVGKTPRETQSHEFNTDIKGVRFNPPWYVPRGIMIRSEIPKLKENPNALKTDNIDIYYHGKKIDPATVDWNRISAKDLKYVSMIQKPGKGNVLGHVRVLMNNSHMEYLHYTNHPWLFEKEQRTFSSGCMRMEKPDAIAGFIMDMPQSEINSYKRNEETVNVKAIRPLKFYSVYRTITLSEDGSLNFLPDIYNRDKAVFAELKKRGQVPSFHKRKAVRLVLNILPKQNKPFSS